MFPTTIVSSDKITRALTDCHAALSIANTDPY